jgi:hypothetical protein
LDEKGFLMGLAARARVICRSSTKHVNVTQDGNRESVTVIETVSADGTVLPPFVIFKGKSHSIGWYRFVKKEDNTVFAVSDKGWTDQELGLEYLVKTFDTYLKNK